MVLKEFVNFLSFFLTSEVLRCELDESREQEATLETKIVLVYICVSAAEYLLDGLSMLIDDATCSCAPLSLNCRCTAFFDCLVFCCFLSPLKHLNYVFRFILFWRVRPKPKPSNSGRKMRPYVIVKYFVIWQEFQPHISWEAFPSCPWRNSRRGHGPSCSSQPRKWWQTPSPDSWLHQKLRSQELSAECFRYRWRRGFCIFCPFPHAGRPLCTATLNLN